MDVGVFATRGSRYQSDCHRRGRGRCTGPLRADLGAAAQFGTPFITTWHGEALRWIGVAFRARPEPLKTPARTRGAGWPWPSRWNRPWINKYIHADATISLIAV